MLTARQAAAVTKSAFVNTLQTSEQLQLTAITIIYNLFTLVKKCKKRCAEKT